MTTPPLSSPALSRVAPHADASPRPNGFWGMVVFLCTDAVMFTLLLVANVYLRRYSHGPAQGSLDPATTLWYSLGLWASSGTLLLAERVRAQARLSGGLIWASGLLGAAFVYGQLQEYSRLIHLGARLDADLFFTGFYTLTGLHGLHVLVGALALLVLGTLRFSGRLGERRAGLSAGLSLYWHFVDAVWVLLFLVLYLWRGP